MQIVEPELPARIDTLTTERTAAEVAETVCRLDAYLERGREMKKQLESALMEWIDANGPLQVGTVRYVVGAKKTTKCLSIPLTIQAILDHCDGDFDQLCQSLSANAIKYGTARSLLPPEVYDQHFVTTIDRTLEGKEVREVKKLDERFMK